ncbi:MAG: M20/M25/M40 family metallo-hydrolase [Balneolaceae bacterium]|nr:M20/M25/M40 family metallo-hydrolase [Balneolaceae bacterium]
MSLRKQALSVVVLLTIPVLLNAQADVQQAVREYREANEAKIINNYLPLLRIPNVASDLPNIKRNADFIMDAFEQRNVEMELLTLDDAPGAPPVIYGELTSPKAERTLIIYVHYDGQPVDPQNWKHNPWEPTLYSGSMQQGGEPIPFPEEGEPVNPDWRIYGRSAADDKAPIPTLLSTLDALQANNIPLTANLKFFFDGEEEIGSPHVQQYLQQYKDRLQGDLWLFCDGPKHQSGRPQVVFGVRGVTGMEVTVYGANRPLHSGHYGGWAPVPGQMLANLLASMKDASGKVLVENFYDSTAPITEADQKAFATMPDYSEQIKQDLGLSWTEFKGQPLIERLMYPTLTVRGLASGNVGDKARNIIPAIATATLGIRLAKGNQPEEMKDLLEAHIRKQGYHIEREEPNHQTKLEHSKVVKVIRGGGYPAMRTPIDNQQAQQVVEAIHGVSEEQVILSPTMGGSLPLFHFTQVLNTPLVIVPIANHDNNQHAPNENIRIGNIWDGMEIYGSIFTM